MPTTLRVDNFGPANLKAITRLDADSAAGAASVTVASWTDLASLDYCIFGAMGGLTSEIGQVSGTPSGNPVSLSTTLKYAHRKLDQLTVLKGNRIRVYRAPVSGTAVPSDSTFLLNLVSTSDIDPNALSTDIADSTGGSGYWYKFTYYNSTSSWESDISSSTASLGADSGHYASIQDIRVEAGFRNAAYVTDRDVSMHRGRAESTINRYLSKITAVPFSDPLPQGVADMARLLAAGYLMLAEYGAQADSRQIAKNGQAKVDDVMGQLRDLVNGGSVLLDSSGNNIGTYSSYGSALPDETTDPYFSIDMTY